MIGYWVRQRAVATVIFSIIIAMIASVFVTFPLMLQKAYRQNAKSLYEKTRIDFVVPEPSLDQVMELPGTGGIDSVFPFVFTRTNVNIQGITFMSAVLLSDHFENIDITMYNEERLIKQAEIEYDNPAFVDWGILQNTFRKYRGRCIY